MASQFQLLHDQQRQYRNMAGLGFGSKKWREYSYERYAGQTVDENPNSSKDAMR